MARFHLQQTAGRFELIDRYHLNQQPLCIDYTSNKLKHRVLRGGKKELLLRAVGAKPGLKVADWTAGLGTDSLLLAAAGCEVLMFERSPVLRVLLQQALAGASHDLELGASVRRMQLMAGDARMLPVSPADVIYLDPMFPERGKSALVNGNMQYLQRFLGPDHDAEALIQSALEQPVKRVVVKRPAIAAPAGVTFSLAAKANRFDVYERPGADCS
jgi:16S rRNA (guanine1516-N2)-methyltransferase